MSQIEEQRLITKIASLYYEEGLKQSEISTQLDLSQSFISRALRRALQDGVVKISVMRLQGLHLELESQLQRRYGVRRVIVVEATEAGKRRRASSRPSARPRPITWKPACRPRTISAFHRGAAPFAPWSGTCMRNRASKAPRKWCNCSAASATRARSRPPC